ncbi:plasmid stabilization protein, partial [Clostridioides difficile]
MEPDIKDLKTGQVETSSRLDTIQSDVTEIKSDVKINRNTLDTVIKHTSSLVKDTS